MKRAAQIVQAAISLAANAAALMTEYGKRLWALLPFCVRDHPLRNILIVKDDIPASCNIVSPPVRNTVIPIHGNDLQKRADDFAASAFTQQIGNMQNYDSFRYSDTEKDGNLTFRVKEGYSHNGIASMEYACNALRWFWNSNP